MCIGLFVVTTGLVTKTKGLRSSLVITTTLPSFSTHNQANLEVLQWGNALALRPQGRPGAMTSVPPSAAAAPSTHSGR